ncbi:heavy-metal-associated domain-containing protein [Arthrobacter sp. M2012083]|uniref:heavy-metal-associated domain-containing protein n=1 Tax=Arthrobacter sp. M2012083 TaxID=1197706 RepID=UPI00031348FA|nr:heavy-metal-associated domain-containing protein [Arthrobacter sp. M2012083]
MQTPSRTELPVTPTSSTGCGCCSTEAAPAPQTAVGTGFSLEGLTCGGCKATVEKAVNAVAGVESATVDLVPGGISRLIVSGSATAIAVRDAVTSAGYKVTS